MPESPRPGQPDPPPPVDPLTADRDALRGPRRVSLLGPLFLAWAVVRQLGFINIGIFTAIAGSGNFQLLGLAASAGLMVVGVLRWLRFTYELATTDEGDQLVTVSGVLSRNRTSVPLDRVQSVSTRQNLLHRILNLVEVSVQTAGSVGAEVSLTAVRPEVADRIRRLSVVTQTSGTVDAPSQASVDPAVPPPDTEPLLRRSVGDTVMVAFTRNPLVLLAPIPLAATVGLEAEDWLEGLFGGLTDGSGPVADVANSAWGVAVLLLLLVMISAVVAVVFTVLRLFDLRLFVDGAGLRRMSGLISRTEVTASVERVQVVAESRNLFERMLGQSEVVLPVAGGAASVQLGSAQVSALQLPGTRPLERDQIVDVILGADHDREPGHGSSGSISRLAVRRWTLWIGLAPAFVVIAALWWLVGAWTLIALGWIPVVAFGATHRQRSWSWSLGSETLRIGNGIITEVRREMPVRKMQNVMLRRGYFHRRHGLADVRVRTASRVQMIVPMLPLAQAEALRDEMLYRVETDPRPFM